MPKKEKHRGKPLDKEMMKTTSFDRKGAAYHYIAQTSTLGGIALP